MVFETDKIRSRMSILRGVVDAIIRPAELVNARRTGWQGSVRKRVRQLRSLVFVYIANLGLYAAPLTLAGFGQDAAPEVPGWFVATVGAPGLWTITFAFVQNCLFLLTATVLTLVTFHVAILVTAQSRGFFRSAYTVIYSTSAYLAGVFTVVWYLSTNENVAAARGVVLDAQRVFVYAIIDALGSTVELPGGRPGVVEFEPLTAEGEWVLAILLVLACYYLYSMYLGARINHRADRVIGLLVVVAVLASPVVYVAGSIIVSRQGVLLLADPSIGNHLSHGLSRLVETHQVQIGGFPK